MKIIHVEKLHVKTIIQNMIVILILTHNLKKLHHVFGMAQYVEQHQI